MRLWSSGGRAPWTLTPAIAALSVTLCALGAASRAAAEETGVTDVPAPEISAADAEFFEERIRPILAQQCYECHSGSIQAKGGLRVDIGLGLRLGGQRGESFVPGKPEQSLLIDALKQKGRLKMPPGGKLDDEDIADFEEWIRRGAPDPRLKTESKLFAPREINWEEEGKHWSLQTPQDHAAPAVKTEEWAKTPIDRFVLSKLETAGLAPAADASKATWLRRVSYDLVGLPPTAGELLDFELDNSPTAYERVVDRLLDSPRFGERWGRHWLDVARYGESTGKERNFVYLQAWRYRDYVIDSFNQDKPYNQFIREQVAGDLLPHANAYEKDVHQIATGFLALNPKGINDRNRESFLLEIVDEQIESVSRALMGTTAVCARCHDHKYDPIKQADYYALGGIFRSTEATFGIMNRTQYINTPELLIPLTSEQILAGHKPPAELMAEVKTRGDALQEKTAEIRKLRDGLPPPPVLTAEEVAKAGVKNVVIDGVLTAQSTARDGQQKSEAELEIEKLETELRKERKSIETLRAKIAEETQFTLSIGVQDREKIDDIPIRVRGEVDRAGPTIPRGFLTAIKVEGAPSITKEGSGRRELADWLAHPKHPLVTRVYVNRVWSKLLGTGLVSTVDDFGTQGAPPTHPELLEHLAVKFVANGWSTKKLIREIALSRVYAVGDEADPKNVVADVDNKLLWRANRKRLEAEVLRDTVMALGGNLDLKRPSGSPLIELGTRELGVDADYSVVHRPYAYRSVYLPYLRGRAPEMLAVFDAADPGLTVGKRDVTSGPDQALYLLNSPLAMEQGKLFARRLLAAPVSSDAERVDLAFRLTVGVPPTKSQVEVALQSIADFERLNSSVASTNPGVPDTTGVRLAAWSDFVHTLFALPEFRYVH